MWSVILPAWGGWLSPPGLSAGQAEVADDGQPVAAGVFTHFPPAAGGVWSSHPVQPTELTTKEQPNMQNEDMTEQERACLVRYNTAREGGAAVVDAALIAVGTMLPT